MMCSTLQNLASRTAGSTSSLFSTSTVNRKEKLWENPWKYAVPEKRKTLATVQEVPVDWSYVERLMPIEIVPEVPKHESYPTLSGWTPPTNAGKTHPYYVRRCSDHLLSLYLEHKRDLLNEKTLDFDYVELVTVLEFQDAVLRCPENKTFLWVHNQTIQAHPNFPFDADTVFSYYLEDTQNPESLIEVQKTLSELFRNLSNPVNIVLIVGIGMTRSDENERVGSRGSGKSAPEETEKEEKVEEKKESEENQDEKPSVSSFFFSGDGAEEGESSDSDDEGGESAPKKKRRPEESTSSIFDNDYAREERMNTNMLSRHVEMPEKPTEKERKKSKYTCKNYLKGKCRFGDKCRFSHPVHNRSSEAVSEVTISSEAKFYTSETPEAQVFHSKKVQTQCGSMIAYYSLFTIFE